MHFLLVEKEEVEEDKAEMVKVDGKELLKRLNFCVGTEKTNETRELDQNWRLLVVKELSTKRRKKKRELEWYLDNDTQKTVVLGARYQCKFSWWIRILALADVVQTSKAMKQLGDGIYKKKSKLYQYICYFPVYMYI